jgi:hypothetical protein
MALGDINGSNLLPLRESQPAESSDLAPINWRILLHSSGAHSERVLALCR